MKKVLIWTSVLIVVVAIIGASAWGLYKNSKNEDAKYIKPYILGMDFSKTIQILGTVDTSTTTTIHDAEGNIIETPEEGVEYTEENGYKTVETKANADESITFANFSKTKDVFKKRLESLKISQYSIKLDESNGAILVNLPENESAYNASYTLIESGNFNIIDSETEEILLDNSSIDKAQVMYSSTEEGTYIFLKISYNKQGVEKLKELNNIYTTTETEQTNETTGETDKVTKSKEISVIMSDYNIGSTVLSNIFYDDSIMLTLGVSNDTEELNSYKESAETSAGIINSGTIPLKYVYSLSESQPVININNLILYILAIAVVFVLILIYKIIKFKFRGLVAVFFEIGYIAGLLLILRYVNVVITIEGITGIIMSALLNYVFMFMLLQSNNVKGVFLNFLLRTIPVYVIAIVFTFAFTATVNSFGMALIWGIILIYIYNAILTRPIFKMIGGQRVEK